MTTHQLGDNPRVTMTTRHPYGTPGPCIHCGQPVDTVEGYLALHAGTADRPRLIAVAHPATFISCDDDTLDDACQAHLQSCWHQLLDQADAGTLCLRHDPGGPRWYLGGEPLHAGTPLQILDADGTWHAGRYEYTITANGCTPKIYLPFAGWDSPQAALIIPTDVAVRVGNSDRRPVESRHVGGHGK